MSDEFSGKGGKPGWLPFDLLGHPVPSNKGQRGRPEHCATAENLEKAVLLYGMNKRDREVAAGLGISIPTLKAKYFSSPQLRAIRANAYAFLEGELLARLNAQSLAGKTSATEKLMKRLDKAQLGEVAPVKKRAVKRKGVKEEQQEAAWDAGREDDGWGPLLHGGSNLPN